MDMIVTEGDNIYRQPKVMKTSIRPKRKLSTSHVVCFIKTS